MVVVTYTLTPPDIPHYSRLTLPQSPFSSLTLLAIQVITYTNQYYLITFILRSLILHLTHYDVIQLLYLPFTFYLFHLTPYAYCNAMCGY